MVETQMLSQQERLHWLETIERALAHNPDAISLLCDRASVLRALGAFAEAEVAYTNLFSRDPENFSGFIELSDIFVKQRRYIEALELRSELLRLHPDDATALALFADIILLSGEAESAATFYNYALKLAPHHTLVHKGLAAVMRHRGCAAEAELHEKASSDKQAFFPRQYRGTGEAIPLLLFVAEAEDNQSQFADRIIDDTRFLVTKAIVERITPMTELPPHSLIFNGIGDADRADDALTTLQTILGRSAAPIINDPRAVAETGRTEMARRLKSLGNVITPKMYLMPTELARSKDASNILLSRGFAFPLLLRIPSYHAGRFFEMVDAPEQLAEVVAKFPELPILAIEYLDVCDTENRFHKMRVMIIDGELYPTHLAYGSGWKLHYFSSDMARDAALREKEERFLSDPAGMLGDLAWAALKAIAADVELDYFGVDFAVTPSGDIVVFECNASMVVAVPGTDEKWKYRVPAYKRFMRAANAMIARRAGATLAR